YMLLFGGFGPGGKGGGIVYLNETWTYTAATGWIHARILQSPPTRVWMSMAYYPKGGDVVLFAGQQSGNKTGDPTLDDTWTYSGGIWRNVTGALPALPHGRFSAVFALDPSSGSLALFGGLSATLVGSPVLDDTWSFEGAWTNEAP
ncbi:MAG: hypothetical protein WA761_03230, partial [Thermoplasmata archaeon]